MNYERKSLLQRMDALVEWTGIPQLSRQKMPMRRYKWWPIFLLIFATATLILTLVFPNGAPFCSAAEGMLMAGSLGFAVTGPMQTRRPEDFYDEREELWRARSSVFAFRAIGLFAMAGIMGFGAYALWVGSTGWTIKTRVAPMVTFGYWLMTLGNYVAVLFHLLPTLHASWTMPEIVEDEPEEEGRLSFLKPRRHQ